MAFGVRDLIADEMTAASIFPTGDAEQPNGANMWLANGAGGYFLLGIFDWARDCELSGGIVLDHVGPFGTIKEPRSTRILFRRRTRRRTEK